MVASAEISMLVVGVGVVVVEGVVVRKEEGQKRIGCLPFASVQDVNWHSMMLSLWRAGLMIVARPKTVPVVVAGSSSMDILRFFDVLWSSAKGEIFIDLTLRFSDQSRSHHNRRFGVYAK